MFGLDLDLPSLLSTIGILAVTGVLAGIVAGLLGIGGGIIFVPAFYFVFVHAFHTSPDIAIIIATGTSLLCMIPTSTVAARAQYKRGNADLSVVKTWAPAMILGVIAGSLISSYFGGEWLAILFGSFMLLNSINTFFRAKAKPMADHLPNVWYQRLIAFCISGLSVMLGIGGGTLTVPVLNACSIEPHKSIGTSSAISLFICIPGAIMLILSGSAPQGAPIGTIGMVNLLAGICVIPLSMLSAPLGVNLGRKIPPAALKRVFAVALFCVSVKMLYGAL